jgi:hypothetical protein
MSSPFQKKFSSSSPLLQGAYESAADNDVYLSTQPQQQQLQNTLTNIGVAAGKEFNKPQNKIDRLQKRIDRRDKDAKTKFSKKDIGDGSEGSGSEEYKKYKKKTDSLSTKSDTIVERNTKKIPKYDRVTGKRNHDPKTGLPIE